MQRRLSDELPKKNRIMSSQKKFQNVRDPFFSAPPLISPMMHAGDLDSQGEKLYRIRPLSLTPEFAAAQTCQDVFCFTGQCGSP
jgi:hypothetical protein